MQKYLVQIYNCGELVDEQISDKDSKIKIEDTYIFDNQFWGLSLGRDWQRWNQCRRVGH